MGISDRCSYSLWVVTKHCFVIFLIECWAALGFSHEGRISAWDFGDFPGVDFICVRYHQCMRFQFQVTFLGWISYLCQMSSVLVISMTRIFIDYCCSRSIVADVFIRIFIDFSYFSACVGCSLWILIHIFTPVNVVVSLDWPELPHRKGVWKYKWLDSHSYGAMWHLCCKHSEDVFLCAPNITDFWFIEWGFDLLGRQLKLSWLFCDRNLFSYFHWWMQTVLYWWAGISISGICFSREFVFAGATFECSFCCVIGFERIAPTAYDAVGDVMVWMAIRWEKCFWDFPRNPFVSFWDSCLFSLLRMMKRSAESQEVLSSVLEQKGRWESWYLTGER